MAASLTDKVTTLDSSKIIGNGSRVYLNSVEDRNLMVVKSEIGETGGGGSQGYFSFPGGFKVMWWHFSHSGTSQQTRDFPYRIFTQPPTILISSSARNDRAAWPISATQYCFRTNSTDTFEFYFIAIGV